MSSWIDTIVSEMNQYNRVDDMKDLCDRLFVDDNGKEHPDTRQNLLEWIGEMLDMAGIPPGSFRKMFLEEYEYNFDDKTTTLINHIWNECNPDEQKAGSDDDDE